MSHYNVIFYFAAGNLFAELNALDPYPVENPRFVEDWVHHRLQQMHALVVVWHDPQAFERIDCLQGDFEYADRMIYQMIGPAIHPAIHPCFSHPCVVTINQSTGKLALAFTVREHTTPQDA